MRKLHTVLSAAVALSSLAGATAGIEPAHADDRLAGGLACIDQLNECRESVDSLQENYEVCFYLLPVDDNFFDCMEEREALSRWTEQKCSFNFCKCIEDLGYGCDGASVA